MAEARKGTGSRRSRQEWRSLLARFDDSGLGVEAFWRREGISAASLYRWRGLLSTVSDDGDTGVVNKTAVFVDLVSRSTFATVWFCTWCATLRPSIAISMVMRPTLAESIWVKRSMAHCMYITASMRTPPPTRSRRVCLAEPREGLFGLLAYRVV